MVNAFFLWLVPESVALGCVIEVCPDEPGLEELYVDVMVAGGVICGADVVGSTSASTLCKLAPFPAASLDPLTAGVRGGVCIVPERECKDGRPDADDWDAWRLDSWKLSVDGTCRERMSVSGHNIISPSMSYVIQRKCLVSTHS